MQKKHNTFTTTARLRILREGAGLSKADVARALGVQRSTVSRIEAGVLRLSLERAAALAKLYGAEVGALVES